MDDQAIHNVLSSYVIENANLKIAIEEQKMLIEDLKKQLEEATKEDDVSETNMA